jgi:hypothetical protein
MARTKQASRPKGSAGAAASGGKAPRQVRREKCIEVVSKEIV